MANTLKPSKHQIFMVDSDCLTFVTGNRGLNTTHIAKIKAAMSTGAAVDPIKVDLKTLSIVDGQHRYMAAKELWASGIKYELDVIGENYDNPLLEAIKLNRNRKSWTLEDYVKAYMQDNNSYKKLYDFKQNHSELSYYVCTQLMSRKKYVKASNGTLSITDEDIEVAEMHYKELIQIASVTDDPRVLTRNIVLAYVQERQYILDKLGSFEKFLVKLKKFQKPTLDSQLVYRHEYIRVVNLK